MTGASEERGARSSGAHTDTFAREQLPDASLWPVLDLSALPDLAQLTRLNAASELLDQTIARMGGERTVFHFPGGSWSYNLLRERANQIAHVLVNEYGLEPGNRVLLRAPNNPMLAACWFAVLKAGGIVVCTMPLLRARELRYILDHARINIALCDARICDELKQACGQIDRKIPIAHFGNGELEAEISVEPTEFADVQTAPTDIAIIAYTSGTTGNAKGTVHFHRDLIAACDCWSKHVLQPTADDVFCGSPPLAFTYGLGALVLFPLRVGASALLVEQTAPPQLLEAIAAHRPSIVFTSPTGYRAMLPRLAEFDVSSLKKCVSAGETLPRSTFDAWKQATRLSIIDGIGATELLHIFISSAGADIRAGSTGRVVPGYTACVVDDDIREVPDGTIGKLAVRGPTGCRYLANEERQRAYVRNGWNLTGDAYVRDADGYFWYQARADDMIISGGYNISGPEVENVLLEHSCVLECGVVGVPDHERGQIVKAFIVLRPGHTSSDALVKELQAFVKAQIAPYKYPRAIEFVDALPRTNTGKLQRFRLRETEITA
jgi:2-aminobenzoate-CoA ligase